MKDFEKELWKQAQEIAREEYESEWGEDTWETQADKYEREDFVWAAYEQLRKVNNETTNTTNNVNKKENITMMNRKNAKEIS